MMLANYIKPSSAKYIGFGVLMLVIAALATSCGVDDGEVRLEVGKKYKIAVVGKDAYFEIINGEDEMSLGLVRDDSFLLGSHLGYESFELLFRRENGNKSITIKDTDGDGLPDYRLVKDLQTGKVVKEIPAPIVWQIVE